MSRLLIVETAGNLWGSERALLDLIDSVSDVVIGVCCPPESAIVPELRARGATVLPYFVADSHKKSRLRRLEAAVGVLRACRQFRPDFIHLNQAGGYTIALPAAVLCGLPITAHIRLFEDVPYLAKRRWHLGRLRGLVAVSEAVKCRVAGFEELHRLDVKVIYDPYEPTERPSNATSTRRPRIVCAARIEADKRQDLLLEALQLLKDEGTVPECVFAGSGDPLYVSQLQCRQEKMFLLSVEWRGFVHDIASLLETSTVLAFPSDHETFGRIILDAWHSGTVPVVYSGSGGAAEIISASRGGILYAEQTAEGLAGALRVALGLDEEQRSQFIECGRRWCAENCSKERAGGAFEHMFALEHARNQ